MDEFTSEQVAVAEAMIEAMIDLDQVKPLVDPKCDVCRGSGSVDGDWVPYGSTSAQLPQMICECIFDYGLDAVLRGDV